MLSRKEQKFIKSLKVKKYRTREECFLVEGAKNVQELMDSDFKIEMIVGTEQFFSLNLKTGNHRNEIVKEDLLGQLGTFKTNEDCMAVARSKTWTLDDINYDDHVFVLDGVGDPGNVGTIIRTLDWFGFNQLVLLPGSAEFYHPKVINSTMGSFARIKVIDTEIDPFFGQVTNRVVAADMEGTPIAESEWNLPSVIVMGSESHGISDETKNYVQEYINIPKYGRAESLNVGMATGIIAGHLRMSM